MEHEVRQRLRELGERILKNSSNELYLSMRFLDVPLSELDYELRMSTFYVGTDGTHIYYNPRFVAEKYAYDSIYVNRSYLHMLLHGIFRHMYLREEREEERWNLACDIAVEYIIDGLDNRATKRLVSSRREELYERLAKELKVFTAEGIYHLMQKNWFTEREIVQYSAEFLVCDHQFWEFKTKKKNGKAQNSQQEKPSQKENPEERSNTEEKEDSEKKENPEKQEENSKQGDSKQEENSDQKDKQQDNSRSEEKKSPELQDLEEQNTSSEVDAQRKQQENRWKEISEKLKTNLETYQANNPKATESLLQGIGASSREIYDYKTFLRKFAVWKEQLQVDEDSFDYGFYAYGMEHYGNIPFLEPLEYKDEKRVEELVIAIDTSGSCASSLVYRFLKETVTILRETETFHDKFRIHLIQCDEEIKEHQVLTNLEELSQAMEHFQVKGYGNTDFRPVFEYIYELKQMGELKKLKGLLYFTDGYGTFPSKKPDFDTAFVFVRNQYQEDLVPPWAMKVVLEEEQIEKMGEIAAKVT